MRSGDLALRLSIIFSVAGVLVLVAGLYEIDRREKSSSATLSANVSEIEQKVLGLTSQMRVLSDQYAAHVTATERRLNKLEEDLRALRSEQAPPRR